MKTQRRLFLGLTLLLSCLVLLAGCGGDDGGDNAPAEPDLAVAAIDVSPDQPEVNQTFTIKITVKNAGKTDSDAYQITISIRDVTRNETYPVGSFNGDPIKAKGSTVAYESDYTGLSAAGNYQVQVEIQPASTDASVQNNKQNQAFKVE